MSMQEKSNNLAGAINAAGKPLELKMSIPNDLVIVRRGDLLALKQEAIFGVFRRDAVEWDKLNTMLSNAPAIEQGEAIAWYREMPMEYACNCIEHINEKGEAVYIDFRMSTPPATKGWIPLYTTPQQSQSVGDALEDLIWVLDEIGAKLQCNVDSLEYIQGVGAMVCEAEEAIRALIKRNVEGVE